MKLNSSHFIRDIEFDIIEDYGEFKKDDRVCDIACGDGSISKRIHERYGCEIKGIDINPMYLRLVHTDYMKFSLGSADKLPYSDSSFNKIICNCALEHFTNDIKSLEEIYRIMEKDGVLILTTDSFSYPIDLNLKHKHRRDHGVERYYNMDGINILLNKTGFKIINNKYYINSWISSQFFNYGIKKGFSKDFAKLSYIFYPLSKFSDWIFGKKDAGYCLAIKAIKRK